jgi:uncharacterized Zn finger protein (UPF0148 family)
MQDTISRQCKNCQEVFEIQTKFVRSRIKKGVKTPGEFCSRQCKGEFFRKRLTIRCANCDKEFTRTPTQANGNGRNKSERSFCSQSCAATYNNTHKVTGTRRSKLESYLEERLRSEFPSLILICNGKDTIGSELDFYFPQLRLAIELNGVFHYEPIYGQDKLEQIQTNDQQKFLACHQTGIELCVVSCTEKYITKIIKERYWSIVKNLVAPLMRRADNTDAQVS